MKHAEFQGKVSYIDLFVLRQDKSQNSPMHVWPSLENPSLHLQL